MILNTIRDDHFWRGIAGRLGFAGGLRTCIEFEYWRFTTKLAYIGLTDGDKTATRVGKGANNPLVLADRPFSMVHPNFTVRVIERGKWLGIGFTSRGCQLEDGDTLGTQPNVLAGGYFCQDLPMLRTRFGRIPAPEIETGDLIRVSVDFGQDSITWFRNSFKVGTVHISLTSDIYPVVNLSHHASVSIVP